jgi:hypothetical protein
LAVNLDQGLSAVISGFDRVGCHGKWVTGYVGDLDLGVQRNRELQGANRELGVLRTGERVRRSAAPAGDNPVARHAIVVDRITSDGQEQSGTDE